MTLLRLDSVARSYARGPNELQILRDVSLSVAAGQLVAVYGSRHAGKTTLLKVAAGFERPSSGFVSFLGTDLMALSQAELARVHRETIAFVERAGPHIPELSARDYVAMPLFGRACLREAHRRSTHTLKRVGIRDCADQRWDDMSNTERTLVGIAHALIREPRLLIVDDPTLGLGMLEREQVIGLLRGAADEEGMGVLMAAPDLPSMLRATEVRLLSRGRLVARDDPPVAGEENIVDFPHHRRAPSA